MKRMAVEWLASMNAYPEGFLYESVTLVDFRIKEDAMRDL